jgi:valyl-tRNA synthetase
MLPLVDREIPLVADEWAKPELGSGCVKITPAHDPNDYEVGCAAICPWSTSSTPTARSTQTPGSTRDDDLKARKGGRRRPGEAGLHSGATSRTARSTWPTPTAARRPSSRTWPTSGSSRWTNLAQSAMDAVTDGRVKIIPERYAKGYLDWLSEKRDWPVSRQLWWGHQIPIWYCKRWHRDELEGGLRPIATTWSGYKRRRGDDQWLICAQAREDH